MHPWLVRTGSVALPTYYSAIAVGLVCATFVLRREARRGGLPQGAVFDTAIWVVPASLVGARLFILVSSPELFWDPWGLLWHGGWVFHGAFFGGLAAVVMAGHRAGLDPWRLMDAYVPAILFGQAFARLGCLGAGCCHGRPADWPLGVEVPWSVTYHVPGHLPPTLLAVPLHPAPLYESWCVLGLFVAISWLRGRQRYAGQALAAMLVGYGVARFVVEFFRGDLVRGFPFGGPLSTGQLTSIMLVAAGIGLHLWRRPSSPS